MRQCFYALILASVLTGCLGTAPQAPSYWSIDFFRNDGKDSLCPKLTSETVRIGRVAVSAPYGNSRLVVLRKDGSLAFDAFNSFAASPSALASAAMFDIVESSGCFGRVIRPDSIARSRYTLEFDVTMLALDCRQEGSRNARAVVGVALLDGREIVATARGDGISPAGDDFSAAFSEALRRGTVSALSALRVK